MTRPPVPAKVRRMLWSSRRELAPIITGVLVLNVLGWALYLSYAHAVPTSSAYVGAGVLAYVLGIRHAFDADHISAIDDSARLIVNKGGRPFSLGFFFAMGHSSVVLIMCVAVGIAAQSVAGPQFAQVQGAGGRIGALVAAAFLLVVGLLNLRYAKRLWRSRRAMKAGDIDITGAAAILNSGGAISRILGAGLRSRVQSGWQMFPIGFIFGLGLESASEVALLGMSATGATSGALPIGALLALPVLFAAGMTLFDTIDSVAMVHVYCSASTSIRQRLTFNLVMTSITAATATFVGCVYLSQILVREAGVTALAPVAGITAHFEQLGYAIVAVYVLVWISAFALWRRSRSVGAADATPMHLSPTNTP